LGEDVAGLGELVADHVGVHPQGDRRVGIAEAGGGDMCMSTGQQQGRRVAMTQIMPWAGPESGAC
jgi:hypothetical protein